MDLILAPWPWFIVGPLITLTMLAMIFFGESFGVSSNLRTFCAIGGAGRFSEFFRFDWKSHRWNLIFIIGVIIGAWLSQKFLSFDNSVPISNETILELGAMGLKDPGSDLVPVEIFNFSSLFTLKGSIMMILGGFLVGFGTRYAGGCTSGHAISGLSNLQLPSLVAVIGFFIGGLSVTYFVLPWLLKL